MAKRPWIFIYNTFDVNTRTSHVAMLSLCTDTDAKLLAGSSDPLILVAYNLLHPVYEAYRIININFDLVKGNYKGDTLAFSNLMDTLPLNLRIWEGAIRAVYVEDSPEEKSIFPNKRSPFLSGTYEDRISAIGTLNAKLLTLAPTLSATQALVESFYNAALSTRLTQQGEEGTLAQQSELREAQRLLVAQALYGVLGLLMHRYRATPESITSYFDLTLLRQSGSAAGKMNLSGQVTDKVTLLPIEGATVEVKVNEEAFTATTGADGSYTVEVSGLEEATDAQVTATATGYSPYQQDTVVVPGEDDTLDILLSPEAP